MTLEKSPIFLNGYDNRENSVSNNGSIQMEEAGSRRRKGKPKKCVDSTLANGSTNIATGSKSDDSGIGTSLTDVLTDFLPSTSIGIGNHKISLTNDLNCNEQNELLLQLATVAGEAFRNGDETNLMIPPSTTTSLLSTNTDFSKINGSNKRKPKKRASEVFDSTNFPVTLPNGFEKILEKAQNDINDGNFINSRPTSANELDLPKKKREIGRCETKATIQGPDGSILDEKYDAEDLQRFVKQFKVLRNKYGFTQGDVGSALGRRYGAEFSQTTISRFEALNLSFKNMCKLKPLLEEWLDEIEQALERGIPVTDLLSMTTSTNDLDGFNKSSSPTTEHDEQISSSPDLRPIPIPKLNAKIVPPLKKRRKRTNLDAQQKLALDAFFQRNPRPDLGQITEIANGLNLDNDVVRVWFCNRRQKMRKFE